MATIQGFYSRVHLYDDLTISVFHFHFLFPVSISTVSNCPCVTAVATGIIIFKRNTRILDVTGSARTPYVNAFFEFHLITFLYLDSQRDS